MASESPWPTELRLRKDRRALMVSFDNGETYTLDAELLRVVSPSAEVQGHSPEQRRTVAGKRQITIEQIVPVGNYAVRLAFADGHDTGIYSWTYLHTLGRDSATLWQKYLDELAAKGLSRDPA